MRRLLPFLIGAAAVGASVWLTWNLNLPWPAQAFLAGVIGLLVFGVTRGVSRGSRGDAPVIPLEPALAPTGAVPTARRADPPAQPIEPDDRLRILVLGQKGSGKTLYITICLELLKSAPPAMWRVMRTDTEATRRIHAVLRSLHSSQWPAEGPNAEFYEGALQSPDGRGERPFEMVELNILDDYPEPLERDRIVNQLRRSDIVLLMINAKAWVEESPGTLGKIEQSFLALLHEAEFGIGGAPPSRRPVALVITQREILQQHGIGVDRIDRDLRHLIAIFEQSYIHFRVFRVTAIGEAVDASGNPVGYRPEDVDVPLCWALGKALA